MLMFPVQVLTNTNYKCMPIQVGNILHTVLPSFSIKTPSWLRNLLPMLMNVSLPNCCMEASPSNIFLTSGFLLSVMSAASDVCSASLFFSMNCAYGYQTHTSLALIVFICASIWYWKNNCFQCTVSYQKYIQAICKCNLLWVLVHKNLHDG